MLVGWMVSVENATIVLQSVDSPGGRYRAEVVREDPGVSSSYEYMVRVMPADVTPLGKSLRLLPFGTDSTWPSISIANPTSWRSTGPARRR